ncbi:50S ribosomal protein L9 [Actinocatenispora rupis]|uniref:Large ribosomal subunit protein bL9 n=1 Tax=Actinocatenispora rupis TaxID=519421 RepID=A0A8J3JC51_9ACTN|nr:50S ribosomal protein L9 [Actinocatenispora rupis]GID13288.1 50S ribosomal protein L9 [Actinocatenispora rupis]
MKIILTQDVSGVGEPGDIVDVKNGYGRNYLLPQGFAIPWTKGAEKQITSIKRARTAREIRNVDQAQEVKAQIEALKVTLRERAGDGGRLFGSVTPAEIVDAVKAAGGPELDRRRLQLAGHIKSLGSYQVQVRLHPEVAATVTLDVVADK